MYEVSYRGETRTVQAHEEVMGMCEALVAALGPTSATEYPKVKEVQVTSILNMMPVPAPVAPPAPPVPPAPVERGVTVSSTGKARSTSDFEAARAAGFAPKASLYERGTMVVQTGVDNAKSSREEHDALPLVGPAMIDLAATVRAEQRVDVPCAVRDLRMLPDGSLTRGTGTLLVDRVAFPSLAARAGLPGGAGGYLSECPPDLRAHNWEAWRQAADPEATIKLRTRIAKRPDGSKFRELIAAVGEGYPAVDADEIADLVREAMPPEARAVVAYDGRQVKVDVEFHSDVKPEGYVSGEFFKAGLRFRSDDTGGGSIKGSAFVLQNLCLNLIVLDRAQKPLFAIPHKGDRDRMIQEMREGMKQGIESLGHFLDAWGYARMPSILTEIRAANPHAGSDLPGADLSEWTQGALLMAGITDALRKQELVPLRGRKVEVREAVLRRWREDPNDAPPLSRQRVVNALTSYAARDVSDPWERDAIERGAGALLWDSRGGRPAPLPWMPVQ